MSERLLRLAERIRDELADLDQVVERAQEGLRRMRRASDDYYLDGVALNLHGFYAGLERLFELIATIIDGTLPGQVAKLYEKKPGQVVTDVQIIKSTTNI